MVEAYWKGYVGARADINGGTQGKLESVVEAKTLFTDPVSEGTPRAIKDPCESGRNVFLANAVRSVGAKEYMGRLDAVLNNPNHAQAKEVINSFPGLKEALLTWVKNDAINGYNKFKQPFSTENSYAALLTYLNDENSDKAVEDLCGGQGWYFKLSAEKLLASGSKDSAPSSPPPLPPPADSEKNKQQV